MSASSPAPKLKPGTTAVAGVRALAATGALRLAIGTALFGICASLTFVRKLDLGFVFLPMAAYVAIAAAAFAGRRHAVARRISAIMPFVDVLLAFLVHRHGMALFPSLAASWAVSSLALFTLVVALAGLSLQVQWAIVVAVLSAVAQLLLLRIAGITVFAMAITIFSLAAVAIATSAVPRIAEAALRQEHQAAITLDSLAQAQEQNRLLGHLQREKDALLEIIVHDMRSPVGAAMLSLEYLSMELKKQANQTALLEATDDALSTLNSLSGMIGQILDTAKLEDGRITLRLDRTDLRQILESAQHDLAPRASSRAVKVEVDPPERLYAALDQRLFPRALEALLSHVLRRTSEGGRLRLAASQDGDHLRIALHSTAPAVAADERERIFDKFPFVEGEARRVSGWGLGLYFCRLVISAHQGGVALEDVDGWPTTFVITLPALSK